MRHLRRAGKWLAVLISAVLIFVVFRGVDWEGMREAFRRANYLVVLLGASIGLCGFVVRAFGWRYLLAPVARLRGLRLFPPVAIGYMANNLFPARLGELVRAYVVGRREDVSKSSALATIVIERIFDGLTLLLILAAVSIFFEFPLWVQRGGWLVAGVFLGLAVGLAVVALKLPLGLRLVDATLGRWLPPAGEKVKAWLTCFVAGLDIARHWPDALVAFALCLVRWLFEACIYLSVVRALGLDVPLHGALFVMVVVNIATMVPSAPGYLGAVQFGCWAALSVFGVEKTMAAAYSVLLHAAIWFPITLTGIACMLRIHVGFGALRQQEAPAQSPLVEVGSPDVC
ncbi:MAG: lysylphosphatidylglycerol synthase transmembrane domain-containing protein [Candidatus Brocadiia bacterium]